MKSDDLVKINKDFFIKSATAAGKTAVFTAFPYLSMPPFSLLIDQGISWLVSKIADGLELSAFFLYIDFRVDKQGKEYVEAAHEADKLQTEEARRKADEAFKRFARFNIH